MVVYKYKLADPLLENLYDQKIARVLYDHPKGLGFNKIQEKTGLPRKTVNNHLKSMLIDGVITKKKLGSNPNSPTIYRIKIDEQQKNLLEYCVNNTFDIQSNKDLVKTKIQRRETASHFLQLVSITYFILLSQYQLLPKGKIMYQLFLNLLEEKLQKFRKSLYKEFSQKERMEIYFQANSIFLWEYARSLGTYLTVVENVKKKRTDKEVINLIGSITPQQIQGFILKLNEGLEKEIPKLEKRFGKL